MADPPTGQVRHTGGERANLHGELAATAISMTVLACIAVALRLFTRIHVTKAGLGADDCKLRVTILQVQVLKLFIDMVIIALAFALALLGMNFKRQ